MNPKRLIAPETEGWNRQERDWSYVADPSEAIVCWEHKTRLRLPSSYRRFMLRFNGGRVYPRLFRHNVSIEVSAKVSMEVSAEWYPSTEPVSMVDPFYSWADVEAHWHGNVYGRGTPPDMLLIGCDPGGLEILLSTRSTDFGQIFCWPHTRKIWGTDGNTELWPQADSFEAFLESLYDLSDGSDYAAWHVPIYDKLAKPLEF